MPWLEELNPEHLLWKQAAAALSLAYRLIVLIHHRRPAPRGHHLIVSHSGQQQQQHMELKGNWVIKAQLLLGTLALGQT